MVNETQICNMALGRVGLQRISSLTESSNIAVVCNLLYSQVRDQVLLHFPWNFAKSRASLTQLADAPAFGYTYQYQLPNDCLRVITMNSENQVDQPVWIKEGQYILTDETEAEIIYIRRVTETGLFTPLFIRALYVALAAELCITLASDRTTQTQLLNEFGGILRLAEATDGREGNADDTIPDTSWISERGTTISYPTYE